MSEAPETHIRVPRAPNGLQRRGRQLWRDLHTMVEFEPHRMVLVEDACREADVIDRLQKSLDKSDLRVKGSNQQQVAAPELAELRLHRNTLSSLLKALSIPDFDEDD
ncbi:hypothetical protein D2E50_00775 [Mycobacteroides abscessus]|nr:hypothetical protein D2E50_00775 [Mycobacteroides abscessus]RIU31426.1 hypothetical protein D2E86_01245 [Mycobacteroides abscessus]